jgi:hypothetical protein
MLKRHLAACLVTSVLTAVPAFAQTSPTAPPRAQVGADHFLTQEQPGQWRGSKLVGLNVYGPENEKVGDINEIIVDQNGKFDAVVIGVGGFLGIGEKGVAVSFGQLKFVNEPRRTTAPAGTAPNPPAGGNTTRTDTTLAREYPDHAVINLTRDQLKAAPNFAYASRTGTAAGRTDAGARTTGTVATPTRDTRRTDRSWNTSEVQAIQAMKVSLAQALDTARAAGTRQSN